MVSFVSALLCFLREFAWIAEVLRITKTKSAMNVMNKEQKKRDATTKTLEAQTRQASIFPLPQDCVEDHYAS